jgi:hypothetical protein
MSTNWKNKNAWGIPSMETYLQLLSRNKLQTKKVKNVNACSQNNCNAK